MSEKIKPRPSLSGPSGSRPRGPRGIDPKAIPYESTTFSSPPERKPVPSKTAKRKPVPTVVSTPSTISSTSASALTPSPAAAAPPATSNLSVPSTSINFTVDDSQSRADFHVKIVCVGDGGCGKTCLMVTYAHGTFPQQYTPTVFENYLTNLRAPNGKLVELALWDTAGQEEYDRLRVLSYPEVNVLLVCFGIDSPSSLDNVMDKWIPEISHFCPDIPFILVGLKQDLRNDMSTIQYLQSQGQKPVTSQQGASVAKKFGAKYLECSARTMTGVSEVFNVAITLVIKDKLIPVKPKPIAKDPAFTKPIKKRRCIIL